MIRVQINKQYIALLFIILQIACKSTNTNVAINKNSEKPKYQIQLIDNKGVELSFVLGNSRNYQDDFLIDLKYTIKNTTNKRVNYLCESCNFLDYYLVMNPDSYQVMSLVHCFESWPKIMSIAPKSSMEFETQILKEKKSNPLTNLGVDFRKVNKFIPDSILMNYPEIVGKIYDFKIKEENIIWSN